MWTLILNAIMNYLGKVAARWLADVVAQRKDEKQNKELIDKQKSAQTEEERRRANRDLSNDLSKR